MYHEPYDHEISKTYILLNLKEAKNSCQSRTQDIWSQQLYGT
jgi:hypothetical protein